MMPLRSGPTDVLHRLTEDVGGIDSVLSEIVSSDVQLVREVGQHTLRAGGKRLRPAFVLLAARAVGREFDERRALRLAAVIETIHMATLIHDDVIDHASTRRGKPTAAAIFGNTASILSGDVLLARAMRLLAEDGDLAVIRAVSAAVVEMAEGEALELAARGDFELSEARHLQILRLKTAALVRCCCEVGALIAGADQRTLAAMADFGHHLGLAFQIVDDLLDMRGDDRLTGKPRGTDYREGCATLPLIYLRETLSSDERAVVARRFGNGVTDDELAMFGGWMDARGAFARAEALGRHHAEAARASLTSLPASDERELLDGVIGFVLDRKT